MYHLMYLMYLLMYLLMYHLMYLLMYLIYLRLSDSESDIDVGHRNVAHHSGHLE